MGHNFSSNLKADYHLTLTFNQFYAKIKLSFYFWEKVMEGEGKLSEHFSPL